MSEVQEMQDDEREALISIYEGDAAFKQVNPTTYQYKVNLVDLCCKEICRFSTIYAHSIYF